MVEIFKTKIQTQEESESALTLLYRQFPDYDMNFDLEDRDKILRVENKKGSIASGKLLKYAESMSLAIIMWVEDDSSNISDKFKTRRVAGI